MKNPKRWPKHRTLMETYWREVARISKAAHHDKHYYCFHDAAEGAICWVSGK